MLNKLQLQNLDQPLCSNCWKISIFCWEICSFLLVTFVGGRFVVFCWLVPQDFNNVTIGFSPICIACYLCFWVRIFFTFLCVRSVTLDSINGKMIRFSSFLINWMNWYNQLLAPLGALIAIPFQWIDTTWERLISPSLRGAPAEKTCCSNGIQLFHCEYKPLPRHLISIIFHHLLPWYPSQYHLRIMFDHCQSQNKFRRKLPQNVDLLEEGLWEGGKGGWNELWQNSVWS